MATLSAGCRADLIELDSIFYNGDARPVHCAMNLDSKIEVSDAEVDDALDRAVQRGEVLELYAHDPGRTVKVALVEHVIAGAHARQLPFVTYADFADGTVNGPGLALSFDDTSIQHWHDMLPMLATSDARVTFFISRYWEINEEERALVHDLATAGHDIEPHTVNHLNAPQYVEEHGLTAYLRDEVQPSIDVLEIDGYTVRAFAYPFGARTGELDDALLERVPVLRSVEFAFSGVVSPCPL
ncbi:hypothetical protein BH11MYX3_BH11MYX3_40730 [soil metagenome]